MPPVKSFGERIADALVEDGLLSHKQVEELLELQKKEGTRLLKLVLDKQNTMPTGDGANRACRHAAIQNGMLSPGGSSR